MLQDVEVSRRQSRSRRWLVVTVGAIAMATAAALVMECAAQRAPAGHGTAAVEGARPASGA